MCLQLRPENPFISPSGWGESPPAHAVMVMEFIMIPAHANYPFLTTESSSRAERVRKQPGADWACCLWSHRHSWRLWWFLLPSRPGERKWRLFFFNYSFIRPHFVMQLLKENDSDESGRMDDQPRRSLGHDPGSKAQFSRMGVTVTPPHVAIRG